MENEYIYTVGAVNRTPTIQDEEDLNLQDIFLNHSNSEENNEDDDSNAYNQNTEESNQEEDNQDEDNSQNDNNSEDEDDLNQEANNSEDEDDNSDDSSNEESNEEDNPYADYSVSAIYAERLKEIEYLPEDFKTKKDLDHVEFLDTLIKKSEETGIKNAEAALVEKYGGEEVLKAAQYLNAGGDPLLLNKRAALDHYIGLDAENADNQEKIVMFAYKMKGISDEDAEIFLETIKERGELQAKAALSAKSLVQLKSEYTQAIETPKETVDTSAQIAQRNEQISSIISKSAVGPFKLTKTEQSDLHDFITKPAYATKVNVNGVVKTKFITGLERAYQRLHSDINKQVLLAKILKDDFNFSVVKEQGKNEATKSVLDQLNRTRKPSSKKKSKPKHNPYYGN